METSPRVSIVVCTRNRCEPLADALESLLELEQASPDFEIVVIDNGSTDDTDGVTKKISEQASRTVRHVFEPTAGIVPARNRGVAEAKGEWIAFFDDDQLAEANWLTELVMFAESRDVNCVGGRVDLHLPCGTRRDLSAHCRMLLGESIGPDLPVPYGGKLTPGAGNLLIRKSLFDCVGLFRPDPTGRGEDTDLYHRVREAGEAVWFVPTAIIHHVIPAERLEDEYFLKLTRVMFSGLAEEKRKRVGWFRFTGYWLAKGLHRLLVLAPKQAIEAVRQKMKPNRDRRLDLRLRALASRILLREGWRMVCPPITRGASQGLPAGVPR